VNLSQKVQDLFDFAPFSYPERPSGTPGSLHYTNRSIVRTCVVEPVRFGDGSGVSTEP
jgi:hypothetical protein